MHWPYFWVSGTFPLSKYHLPSQTFCLHAHSLNILAATSLCISHRTMQIIWGPWALDRGFVFCEGQRWLGLSSGPEQGTVQGIHIYGTPSKYSVEKEGRHRKMWSPVEIQLLTACPDNLCMDKSKPYTSHKVLFYILRELLWAYVPLELLGH